VPGLVDNPFATLTIIVAPAILTNASSVLCLGVGNRIARVVDRTRVLSTELGRLAADDPARERYLSQLRLLKFRAHLLLRAMRLFYASIGSFALAALVSVIGALVAASVDSPVYMVMGGLGLLSGSIGVAGLVIGCTLMVRETRLAVNSLAENLALL
jgi:hypothetical protein